MRWRLLSWDRHGRGPWSSACRSYSGGNPARAKAMPATATAASTPLATLAYRRFGGRRTFPVVADTVLLAPRHGLGPAARPQAGPPCPSIPRDIPRAIPDAGGIPAAGSGAEAARGLGLDDDRARQRQADLALAHRIEAVSGGPVGDADATSSYRVTSAKAAPSLSRGRRSSKRGGTHPRARRASRPGRSSRSAHRPPLH